MKKLAFWSALSILFFSACTDNLEETVFASCEDTATTRVITPEVSPLFNWDDTISISLFNVPGSVTLPWYSTASTSIPDFILENYKAADGWKLVYNTCSPSNIVQDDKYYLIFYNIFSGKLRCYVYNKNDVTSGDMTFWQLAFNNTTSLLNDLTPITPHGTTPSGETQILTSNLSFLPTKALSRGWNAFEVDFLNYDPNMKNRSIAMSISPYDIDVSQLEFNGNINLSSEGTMVTTTTITSLSVPGFLTKGVSLLGDSAKVAFDRFIDKGKSNDIRSIWGSAVAGIVKAGGNFLVNKFFGRPKTQTITSNSDIKISTNGTFYGEGEITSQQQSNISPLSHLMLPGSNPTPEDVLLPSYNEPLGVWYLKEQPKITGTTQRLFHNQSKDEKGYYTGYLAMSSISKLDESSIKVVINPAILPFIEKYEVSAKLIIQTKTPPSLTRKIQVFLDDLRYRTWLTYTPYTYGKEYYSTADSLYTLMPTNAGEFIGYAIAGVKKLHLPQKGYDLLCGPYPYRPMLPQGDKLVRVSVTIYPKAPYNSDPFVSTRTFKPVFDFPSGTSE